MITRRLGAPLTALCLLFSWPAAAELSSYRLELLVFRHLEGAGEPVLVEELEDYAALPTLEDAVPPDGLTLQPEMSPTLADVWRRLRLSATFRPLLYASWDQDNTQFQPPMRLHGEEVLDEALRFPGNWVSLDLSAEDPLAAYRAPLYRLDGHASLRRSRFLHVDLDLELRSVAPPGTFDAAALAPRTPAGTDPETAERPGDAAETNPMPGENDPAAAGPLEADAGPWHVERLRQSRQVRVGELHYFDSPVLGVIARVTAVENPR